MPGLVAMDPNQQILHQQLHKEEDDYSDDFGDRDDAPTDGSTYISRPKLPDATILKRPLRWLVAQLDAGVIDVNPEYQREVVWTADRMTGLINSLMENFYIPPIILNKEYQNETSTKFKMVCVDGKQRLSSVRAFIKGMIPCHDQHGEKWWFCNTTIIPRNVLPEPVQNEFLDKEFVSFEFNHLNSEQEEDLFARVQMGVPLTPAEKIRASSGPWQELAKTFVADFPNVFSLLKDRTHSKDFQLALGCFNQILEVQHPSGPKGNPLMKCKLAAIQKLIANGGGLDDRTRSHLAAVFQKFNDLIERDPEIFRNTQRRLTGSQFFAQIEMVAMTVLLSMYGDSENNRNDSLLLGDLKYFRQYIRDQYVDLRINEPTWRHIWEYCDNLEQFRGAVDGNTVKKTARKERAAPVSVPLAEEASQFNNPAPPTPRATPASPVAEPARPVEAASLPLRRDQPGSPVKRTAPNNIADEGQNKRLRVDTNLDTVKQEAVELPFHPPFPTKSPTMNPSPQTSLPTTPVTNTPTQNLGHKVPPQPQAPQSLATKLKAGKQMARRSSTPNPGVTVRRNTGTVPQVQYRAPGFTAINNPQGAAMSQGPSQGPEQALNHIYQTNSYHTGGIAAQTGLNASQPPPPNMASAAQPSGVPHAQSNSNVGATDSKPPADQRAARAADRPKSKPSQHDDVVDLTSDTEEPDKEVARGNTSSTSGGSGGRPSDERDAMASTMGKLPRRGARLPGHSRTGSKN